MSRFWKAVSRYLLFFVMVAFPVTCTVLLFTTILMGTLDITLTAEDLNIAAKLTLVNVLALTALFTLIDLIRRKLTVQRSTRRIVEAGRQIMAGNFAVRLSQANPLSTEEGFNEIIDCFNNMARELGSVETLRTDFIANVSHEMKTPLAVMQNYGTLLQEPGLTEEKRLEYARGINDAARHLADMMTNILKLNRLENQQIYPQAQEYDLGEQLCESLLQYESVWEEKHIAIETDLAEGVTVRADGELLSLVWNNLLSNAFKFTPEGGTVALGLTADDNFATVQVRDTGCGISAQVGAHIFEKFYQGDSSHATQGNGLGLALVRRVVDILHGEITVESTLGLGSTFTVKVRRWG